jgi:hypothetical protein
MQDFKNKSEIQICLDLSFLKNESMMKGKYLEDNSTNQAIRKKRKYHKRKDLNPPSQIIDKYRLFYWKKHGTKIYRGVRLPKVTGSAELQVVIPSKFCTPTHLMEEMMQQITAWREEKISGWKFIPDKQLSETALCYLKSFFYPKRVKNEETGNIDTSLSCKWNLQNLKLLIALNLKLWTKEITETSKIFISESMDYGKYSAGERDKIIFSFNHIHHYLKNMLPFDSIREDLLKSWKKAIFAYQSGDYIDPLGCKCGEKILLEIPEDMTNPPLYEEWQKQFLEKTKNYTPTELNKQILWNSRRNVGFRKIKDQVFIYLITSVSQLNFWQWCLDNHLPELFEDNMEIIHQNFMQNSAQKKSKILD